MYNDLYHIGMPRRSGRYKWGSGKNPYHHGTSTASGQKRKHPSLFRKNKVVKKEVIRKPTEKQKSNIITSADPKQIQKYKKFLSNNELDAAIKRVNLDKTINKLTAEEKHKGLKKFEEMSDTFNRTAMAVDKIAKGYDVYAHINNAFTKNPNQKMPYIYPNKDEKKKQDKKKKSEWQEAQESINNKNKERSTRRKNKQKQKQNAEWKPVDIKLFHPELLPSPQKKKKR